MSGRAFESVSTACVVDGKSLPEVVSSQLSNAWNFKNLSLTGAKAKITNKILKEITDRLHFLMSVGLNYLSLSRRAETLSGGEGQRIRLASQIGSGLVSHLYS